MRFSLVYPTRHRPAFIKQALAILEKQEYQDFEIIVSDNYIDPDLSCEEICNSSSLPNIKYVKPPEPVGMVKNWNHALSFATGDYVCFFTDKMFLLPNSLKKIENVLNNSNPEIISWITDMFHPSDYKKYFGHGRYYYRVPDDRHGFDCKFFIPINELNKKGELSLPRTRQSPSEYCRGKIVFGAFHRELIKRIISKYGQLFHDISPDYTSMILGLYEARSACELSSSCVVSIITDISNGALNAVNDQCALSYLASLETEMQDLFSNMVIPGLYSSQHNVVCHDYIAMAKKFGLEFSINQLNWAYSCYEDLQLSNRKWSNRETELMQKKLFNDYLEGLSEQFKSKLIDKIHFESLPREDRKRSLYQKFNNIFYRYFFKFYDSIFLQGKRPMSWKSASLADALQRREKIN